MKTVRVRHLRPAEFKVAMAFQQFITLILEMWQAKKGGHKTGWVGIHSIQHYEDVKHKLEPLRKYPFTTQFFEQVSKWDQEIARKLASAAMRPEHQAKLNQILDPTIKAFLAGDIEALKTHNSQLRGALEDLEPGSTTPDHYLDSVRNPYHIEDPLIFGPRAGILQHFMKKDMQEVVSMDLQQHQYTYIPLSRANLNNFEFVAHWVQELRSTNAPVKLDNESFIQYSKIVYSSIPAYEPLVKLVGDYLHNNDKSLIPKILELLTQVPDLYKVNEQMKREINTVYRGIPMREVEGEDRYPNNDTGIINHDYTTQYVATSMSRSVAIRFAYQIGHLESRDSRRSQEGVIIKYAVTPEAIILDTKIFGGLFSESEVLIDATKAEPLDVEWV